VTARAIGGYNVYGRTIGILMLESSFPRIPGDIGNATTFDFPVAYKVVRGASGQKLVDEPDSKLRGLFIESAQELEKEGVKAITTSCGFLALFQKEIASAVSIPVFTSSLMQVPLAYSMLKREQKVGIITALKRNLTKRHLAAIGIENIPTIIVGMDNSEEFMRSIHGYAYASSEKPTMDVGKIEREMVEAAKELVKQNPEVGAIVFECHNIPPYAFAVQEATNLPVFDIVTLTNMVYSAVVRRRIRGLL
jgi:Asp/Glu/hydantoin racemase